MQSQETQWVQYNFLFAKEECQTDAANRCNKKNEYQRSTFCLERGKSQAASFQRLPTKKVDTLTLSLFSSDWESLNRKMREEQLRQSLRELKSRWLRSFPVSPAPSPSPFSAPSPAPSPAQEPFPVSPAPAPAQEPFSTLGKVKTEKTETSRPESWKSNDLFPKTPHSEGFLAYLRRKGWERSLMPTMEEIVAMSGEEKWKIYCKVAGGKMYQLATQVAATTRGLYSLEEALQELRIAAWLGCNDLSYNPERSHLFSFLWTKIHWCFIGLLKLSKTDKRNGYSVSIESKQDGLLYEENLSLESEVDASDFFRKVRERIAKEGTPSEQRISAAFFRQRHSQRAYAALRRERRFLNSLAKEAQVSLTEVSAFLDGLKSSLLKSLSFPLLSKTFAFLRF